MFTKIAVIGTGNIGAWLSQVFKNQNNMSYISISGRTIDALTGDCDLYIFALKDDVYDVVLQKIPFKMRQAVHTSGALSQNILSPYAEKFGVLYPYQSIMKGEGRERGQIPLQFIGGVDAKRAGWFESVPEGQGSLHIEIPICIEGSDAIFEDALFQWASAIFTSVYKINEKQRFAMHLAAIFANNFTNAMYSIAYQIFKDNNVEWSLIFPLLENTLAKARADDPHLFQTGPAIRNDVSIMEKHCSALPNEELKTLYRLVSKIIQKK